MGHVLRYLMQCTSQASYPVSPMSQPHEGIPM